MVAGAVVLVAGQVLAAAVICDGRTLCPLRWGMGRGTDLPDCGTFFIRTDSIVTSRATAATITMTNNN